MTKLYLCVLSTVVAAGLYSCNSGTSKQNIQDSASVIDSANTVRLDTVTSAVHFPVELKCPPDGTHRLFIADVNGKM
jgi:hypothetical protein